MRGNNGRAGQAARWATGLAAGSVLLGHGITYAIVHPDAHDRAGVLAATGHAYLHLLEGPGIVLAIVSALAAALIGLGRLGASPDPSSLFRHLAAAQLSAFVAMEILERVASGAAQFRPSDAMLIVLGVVIQLALARLGAWLLAALNHGGRRLAAAIPRLRLPLPRPAFRIGEMPVLAPARAPVAGPPPGRGPPLRRR